MHFASGGTQANAIAVASLLRPYGAVIAAGTGEFDGLETGAWIEFARNHGAREKSRLAWISPRSSRFAVTSRQGLAPFALTFDELAQAFRQKRAFVVAAESVVDRALAAALDEVAGG